METSRSYLFVLFALLAVVLRLPGFFTLVMDHDESTYIIIADQLLDGKIPYVDNLDVKPVGIYLLFAILLKWFDSIIVIRLFAALVIALSGYFIYLIHYILFSHRKTAIFTGILFILCASAHKWSWSANTEIFFQCCSLAGLYCLLVARRPIHFVLFGLITGLGFLVKFHIVFDVLALVIFYFYWTNRRWKTWLWEMLISFTFFLIPILIVVLYYWNSGYLSELRFAMLEIPSQYASEIASGSLVRFISEFYLSFLPVVIALVAGIWTAYKRNWMLTPHWVLFISWTILSWLGISFTGKLFFHYYFQALPAFCLFALVWFMIKPPIWLAGVFLDGRQNLIVVLLILVLASWTSQYIQVLRKPNTTSMIYEEIRDTWHQGDRIYTTDQNILYYLLQCELPTEYVHTTILFNPELIRAYEVDVADEFEDIVTQKMDYYVISRPVPEVLQKDIDRYFELSRLFPNDVRLFRRKNKL